MEITGVGWKKIAETDVLLDAGLSIDFGALLVTPHTKLRGSMKADQSGSLVISQSINGSDFDVKDQINIYAGSGQGFVIDIIAPWVNIFFLNTGMAQGYFRLTVFSCAL